jgi:putative MFS transporter
VICDTGKPLPAAQNIPVEIIRRMPFGELWKPPYRSRTIMLCVFNLLQTVGFYGFANWAPTFLLHQGRNLGQSLNYSFLFALMNPVGPLIGVATTERLERKRAIVMLSLLIATTGMAFAYARSTVAIVAIGAVMTVFSSWFSSVFHAYQAELFPTRARATGVGFTFSWSRLSAVFSTLIIGALLVHGILAVFIFIALAMVGVALVVGIFGPRTNAVVLEEISQ